jgi:hypothetical protein
MYEINFLLGKQCFRRFRYKFNQFPTLLAMSKEQSSQVGNRYYALLGAAPRVTRQTS